MAVKMKTTKGDKNNGVRVSLSPAQLRAIAKAVVNEQTARVKNECPYENAMEELCADMEYISIKLAIICRWILREVRFNYVSVLLVAMITCEAYHEQTVWYGMPIFLMIAVQLQVVSKYITAPQSLAFSFNMVEVYPQSLITVLCLIMMWCHDAYHGNTLILAKLIMLPFLLVFAIYFLEKPIMERTGRNAISNSNHCMNYIGVLRDELYS